MKRGNLIIALILEGLGIWVMVDSLGLGLQKLNDPGPGLFPFLLGGLLCLLSLPLCIEFLRKGDIGKEEEGVEYSTDFKKLCTATAYLIGYILLLDILGFLITSFLFLFGLFWIGNPRKWLFVAGFSAGVVALAYIVFVVLLQLHFPTGILR